MMFDPDLILLDEPFGGINPALVERLTEIVLQLNRENGQAINDRFRRGNALQAVSSKKGGGTRTLRSEVSRRVHGHGSEIAGMIADGRRFESLPAAEQQAG